MRLQSVGELWKQHIRLDQDDMPSTNRPTNLAELKATGWKSRSVKEEKSLPIFQNMLASGAELFPGIVGYENTVVPEVSLALLAGHDILFSAKKVKAKAV